MTPRRHDGAGEVRHGVRRQARRATASPRATRAVVDTAGHRHRARRGQVVRVAVGARRRLRAQPTPAQLLDAGQPAPTPASRRNAEIACCRAEGVERVGTMSDRDFLVAGLALYAGEGAKTDGSVQLRQQRSTHHPDCSSPGFGAYFDVVESKFRVRLYLHVGLDLAAATDFWCDLTGIPPSQFYRPYRAVADPSIRRTKHVMGCPGVVLRSRSPIAVSWGWSGRYCHLLPFRGSSVGRATGC